MCCCYGGTACVVAMVVSMCCCYGGTACVVAVVVQHVLLLWW